jgi:hypothetical protein
MRMKQPSSTITAATLAGMFMTLVWALIAEYTNIPVSEYIVALSTTFVVALVGYLKREVVLEGQFMEKMRHVIGTDEGWKHAFFMEYDARLNKSRTKTLKEVQRENSRGE